MENKAAAHAFATLGHPDRLAIYRMLMRFAPKGVRPTEIAQALGFKANTLSHHLSDLTSAGLAQVERQGRSLLYAVDLPMADALVTFLALDVGRSRSSIAAAPSIAQGRVWNVLFICSGNSARSLFAEALLRDLGQGRFVAYSAGTRPGSVPNPFALAVLERNGHRTDDLSSKHIDLFQRAEAPKMDFVFTVCDTAAFEECLPWSGQPITGHWGLPDPVKATGTDAEKALVFAQTYAALRRRIAAFAALPIGTLDRLQIQACVDAIAVSPEEKE